MTNFEVVSVWGWPMITRRTVECAAGLFMSFCVGTCAFACLLDGTDAFGVPYDMYFKVLMLAMGPLGYACSVMFAALLHLEVTAPFYKMFE